MNNDNPAKESIPVVSLAQWSIVVFAYLLVPLILIGISHDLGWWQAWVFSVICMVIGTGGRMFAESRHPGLMAERLDLSSKKNFKTWDRILSPLLGFSVLYLLVIVAGIEHFYDRSPVFPMWLTITSFIIIIFSYCVSIWAMAANRFFSFMVRIQMDRGHTVCDTGPYRYVRHPGYAGHVLSVFCVAIVLDSYWTFIASVIALIVIILRTTLEDRTLIQELPGYKEYAQKVRYRLIPGIW